MTETVVQDVLFGELCVVVSGDRTSVVVRGDQMPDVVLHRKDGAVFRDHVPIGTRDAAFLQLSVNGAHAVIAPGAGRLSKRSYRVTAMHNGVRYLLVPCSATTSELLRDGLPVGELTVEENGDVSAVWKGFGATCLEDAAIGYALAASFGTGARSFLLMLIERLLDALPG